MLVLCYGNNHIFIRLPNLCINCPTAFHGCTYLLSLLQRASQLIKYVHFDGIIQRLAMGVWYSPRLLLLYDYLMFMDMEITQIHIFLCCDSRVYTTLTPLLHKLLTSWQSFLRLRSYAVSKCWLCEVRYLSAFNREVHGVVGLCLGFWPPMD